MLVKIGILGAMLEEVSSIKEMMVITKENHIAGRIYYEGHIGDTEIILTFSRWGKVAAATTVTTLINIYNIDFVLFTGVAGGVSESLNIGDIIIGKGLYQHDMDARPFFDQYQIPLTTSLIFKPESSDVVKAEQASHRFVDKITTIFNEKNLSQFSIFKPAVHTGLIASGDQFIQDTNNHENLKLTENDQQTLAVEMEGASVAQVCEEYRVPYIVIRVISDKADHSAKFDFALFIKEIASQYSAGIVKEYIELKSESTNFKM